MIYPLLTGFSEFVLYNTEPQIRLVLKTQKTTNILKLAKDRIQKKTNVPVLIPSMFESELQKYYANSNKAEYYGDEAIYPDLYSICVPIKLCMNGKIISKQTLDGFQEFRTTVITSPEGYLCKLKPNSSRQNRSGYITLSKGIRGFYYEPNQPVYCGYPKITWRQGKYQYSISKKFGTFEELVKLANSAIYHH
jgi:hypothetical protein